MLQQPSRDEWPGQRGTRRPAKRCQGHCLCRVCGVAHEACELRRLLEVQQMDGRLDGARGPDGARLRDIYQSGDYDCTALSVNPPQFLPAPSSPS